MYTAPPRAASARALLSNGLAARAVFRVYNGIRVKGIAIENLARLIDQIV